MRYNRGVVQGGPVVAPAEVATDVDLGRRGVDGVRANWLWRGCPIRDHTRRRVGA